MYRARRPSTKLIHAPSIRTWHANTPSGQNSETTAVQTQSLLTRHAEGGLCMLERPQLVPQLVPNRPNL
eukprot:5065589-Amphidinium_carterae.1